MADKRDPSIGKALESAGRLRSSKPPVDLDRADNFIEGAGRSPSPLTPIEGLDPEATPRIRVNILLNEYEQAALKRRSERTGLSMHKILRGIVIPVLVSGEEGRD